MKYRAILADPPWPHDNYRDTKHGSSRNYYNSMTLQEICELPVESIAADDSMLFLWVTAVAAAEGWHVRVMEAWGCEPKTIGFVWAKRASNGRPYCGLGRYTRSGAELCFLGRRGKFWRESASVYQVIEAPVGRHSAKPPGVHDRIEKLLGDVPRIELFARERRPGWDVMGDEVEGWAVALQGGDRA